MIKKDRGRKGVKIGIFGLAALGVIIFCFALFIQPKAQREDYKKIASSNYDTAFLAMYPVDTYEAEDFLTYRGMTIFLASYCIPDLDEMKQYMKRIAASENIVSTVYLGIRPDKMHFQDLEDLCALYPDIDFEVILSYPSASYWSGLSEVEYDKVMRSCREVMSSASNISNANFYCFSTQKWLLKNPDNYRDEWTVTKPIARKLMLFLCDAPQDYAVTSENSEYFFEKLQILTGEIKNKITRFSDLSDRCVVFLGDSVIGNYTDSTSVPGVVEGLTGAEVYNCGYGGNSAAMNPGKDIALAGIAEAFAQRDLSALPSDIQTYRGISAYLSDAPEDPNLCVVINYGLNDYFEGNPISSGEDLYDITTYCGAIRKAVALIRASYPEAQIILCTPSYCTFYQFGTEPHGEEGHVLTDYVETVLALANELGTSALDTYHEFGINCNNWSEYLVPDQVHPNEAYRYLIGEKLSLLIQ